MGRAYSLDLRDRVVAAVLGGKSCSEAAVQFAVSKSSAIKWSRRKRETGSAAPAKIGGYRPFLLADQKDKLLQRMAEKADVRLVVASQDADVWWRADRGGLFTLLKNKRELWKQVQPNKPFPGVCILQVDQNVPALVVKSVFQTAAFAGYPNVSFMVGKLPKSD